MLNYEIAKEVLAGKWGNGNERRERLESAGYDFDAIQSIVNALVYGDYELENKEQEQEQDERVLRVEIDTEKYDSVVLELIV